MVVAATSGLFDRIDFLIIFTRPLALVVVMVISVSVQVFLAILIVIETTSAIVDSPMVVTVVVTSWRVVRLQSSSHIFPNQLLNVVDVCVVFGSGEMLSNRGQSFLE